jgi:hypothetical protein
MEFNWEWWVEQQIRQAQAEGKFDHLEGKGKPLKLDPEDATDPALALAHRLLHDQGLLPAWLEREQYIVDEIRLARRTLLRSYHWCEWALAQPGADEAQVKGEWREAVAAFQDALEKINAQILTFNLELPPVLAHRQRSRLKLEDELRRLGLPDELARP